MESSAWFCVAAEFREILTNRADQEVDSGAQTNQWMKLRVLCSCNQKISPAGELMRTQARRTPRSWSKTWGRPRRFVPASVQVQSVLTV